MGSETAKKRSFVEVAEGRYQSTDAGMEEEVGIDDTPEEVARALFVGDPPVVKSGKDEGSKRSWRRWLSGRW